VLKPQSTRPRLIFVNDRLVGLVKGEFEPSFLALRNVTDRRGRLVLVMGGVYTISNAIPLASARPRDVDGVPELRLTSLGVRPKSFLLNYKAWAQGMPSLILRVAKPHLTKRELKDVRSALEDFKENVLRIDIAAERLVWFALLDALASFRDRFEYPSTTAQSL
jgi:hypothetical protein